MLPDAVVDLFTHQYSLAARHQLRDRCTPAERRRLAEHPDLELVSPRVFRHRAGPVTLGQQLLLPVLDAGPGSILWARAGAHWWGFGRFRAFPVHVARPARGRTGEQLARIYTTNALDAADVTEHRGIPIARPERLILWLARDLTSRVGHEIAALRLERTLDHAWREDLINGDRIHELARRKAGKGNAGIVVLRQVLETRPPDYRPTDSGLERRWEEVVGALAAQFRRQVDLGDDGPIGRFDQVHVNRPLVVEVHSEKYHTTHTDVANDEERLERLVAAGFAVVVYWQYDIWHDPHTVRRSLREILAAPHAPRVYRPTPAPHALVPAPVHTTSSDRIPSDPVV